MTPSRSSASCLLPLYTRGTLQLRSIEAGRRALPSWRVRCFTWALVTTAVARQANLAGVFTVFIAMFGSGPLAGLFTFGGSTWYTVHRPGRLRGVLALGWTRSWPRG